MTTISAEHIVAFTDITSPSAAIGTLNANTVNATNVQGATILGSYFKPSGTVMSIGDALTTSMTLTATTLTLGKPGGTVTILGDTTYVSTTNLQISDNVFQTNVGGITTISAGWDIMQNGNTGAYIHIDSLGNMEMSCPSYAVRTSGLIVSTLSCSTMSAVTTTATTAYISTTTTSLVSFTANGTDQYITFPRASNGVFAQTSVTAIQCSNFAIAHTLSAVSTVVSDGTSYPFRVVTDTTNADQRNAVLASKGMITMNTAAMTWIVAMSDGAGTPKQIYLSWFDIGGAMPVLGRTINMTITKTLSGVPWGTGGRLFFSIGNAVGNSALGGAMLINVDFHYFMSQTSASFAVAHHTGCIFRTTKIAGSTNVNNVVVSAGNYSQTTLAGTAAFSLTAPGFSITNSQARATGGQYSSFIVTHAASTPASPARLTCVAQFRICIMQPDITGAYYTDLWIES